jgi:hypothetical protein
MVGVTLFLTTALQATMLAGTARDYAGEAAPKIVSYVNEVRTLRAASMAKNRNRARASRVLYCANAARTQPGVSAGSTKRKYRSETSATSTPAIP